MERGRDVDQTLLEMLQSRQKAPALDRRTTDEFERWCAEQADAIQLPARIDDGKSAFTENPADRPSFLELMKEARYAIMDIVDELKSRGLMRRSICHNDGEPYWRSA